MKTNINFKKHKRIVIIFLIIICVFINGFLIVFAHQGNTDYRGGHYDRSDDTYHYHHGYPAHLHPNGNCPYDFKNNEQYSDNSTKENIINNDDTEDFKSLKDDNKSTLYNILSALVALIIWYFVIPYAVVYIPKFFIYIFNKFKKKS